MSFLMDILIIVIFAVCVGVCIYRGIVKSLYKSLGFVAALICALMLTSFSAALINDLFINDASYDFVKDVLKGENETLKVDELIDDLSSADHRSVRFLKRFGVDVDEMTEYLKNSKSSDDQTLDKAVRKISDPAASLLSGLIGFVVSFVLCFIAITVLSLVLGAAAKLPVIKTFNRFLGGIYGALLGLMWVSVAALIIGALYPAAARYFGDTLNFEETVSKTFIFKYVSEYNPILAIINSII